MKTATHRRSRSTRLSLAGSTTLAKLIPLSMMVVAGLLGSAGASAQVSVKVDDFQKADSP